MTSKQLEQVRRNHTILILVVFVICLASFIMFSAIAKAAPSTIENYETKGQWRTKINAGFVEHESEINANVTAIAANAAAITLGSGLTSLPTAANQIILSSASGLYDWDDLETWTAGDYIAFSSNTISVDSLPWDYCFALSSVDTNLTTGTVGYSFHMPFAATLTWAIATVDTPPTGAAIQVDVNEEGTSVFSTVVSIDAGTDSSEDAATAPVISDSALSSDTKLTFDIDQVGSTVTGQDLQICIGGIRNL